MKVFGFFENHKCISEMQRGLSPGEGGILGIYIGGGVIYPDTVLGPGTTRKRGLRYAYNTKKRGI